MYSLELDWTSFRINHIRFILAADGRNNNIFALERVEEEVLTVYRITFSEIIIYSTANR